MSESIEPATVAISDETVSLTSPAAESASKQLAPNDALQSDHISYKPMEEADLQLETADEDASQKSNLVDQKKEYISTPHTVSPDKSKDDPPSEQVKRQTPTRRISRIEDSVEALDALEEAIESIDQAMPAPKNDISSSVAVTKGTKNATKSEERKPTISRRPTKAAPNKSKDTPASTEIKSSNTLRSGGAKSATAHQIQMKASLLGGSPANGPRSTQPLAETQIKAKTQPSKRVSSLHKAPFLPAKSTKPLTTSNFELPGETVARKLKEQREERQKKEEEERTKAQPFKARPVPVHRTPEVKLTASAKARLSMAQNAPPNDTKPKAALLTGNISASPTNRRQSTLNVSKRTTASPMSRCSPPTANTSIKRQPSLSATMKSRKPSILNEPRPVPTAEDLAHQRMKGKEVFNRPKMMLCEKEKERKAKEEAAKKARVEAAERGRIASREWAEKQKARQMAVKKIKEGEDGATTA